MANDKKRVAWITGGSSGIGLEVARRLVNDGWSVALSARSADKLNQLAGETTSFHAYPLDVTDADACERTAQAITDEVGPVDRLICAAGLWAPMKANEYDGAKIAKAVDVNIKGVVHPVMAVLEPMKQRGSGQIGIISSVAGYRGLPRAVAYGPTKAALINMAETLRHDLTPYGIKVSVINPGFVKTPMTADNDFPMPFIMEAEKAAQIIVKGLDRDAFEIAFPWQLVGILKTLKVTPDWLFFRMFRQKKTG